MYIHRSVAFIYYLNRYLQYIDSRRSIKCETKGKVKKNKKAARALAFAFENTSWQGKRNRLCCLANPTLPCFLPCGTHIPPGHPLVGPLGTANICLLTEYWQKLFHFSGAAPHLAGFACCLPHDRHAVGVVVSVDRGVVVGVAYSDLRSKRLRPSSEESRTGFPSVPKLLTAIQ